MQRIKQIIEISSLIMLLPSLFIPISCGNTARMAESFVSFSGKVFEWNNAPSGSISRIYIAEKADDTGEIFNSLLRNIEGSVSKTPVENATVTISRGFTLKKASDKNGYFWKMSSVDGSGTGAVSIKVTKSGYIVAEGEGSGNFSGLGQFTIVALLVKQSNQNDD